MNSRPLFATALVRRYFSAVAQTSSLQLGIGSLDARDLWRPRVRVILENVAQGVREHRELASVAAQIQADYHGGRFLIELLQNASDQAALARMSSSTVVIVRTDDLVAVSNKGLPFSREGVNALSSIGLSPKSPSSTIGHKGLGFKSVFEVTDAPEVYSADAPGRSFADSPALRLYLTRHPFEDDRLRDGIRSLIEETLSGDVELARRIRDRVGAEPMEPLLDEMRAAAPFHFPLLLDRADLERKLLVCAPATEAQTLVVLPLAERPHVQEVVSAALADLLHERGASLLFLPAVTRILLVDRVAGKEWEIVREDSAAGEWNARGAWLGEARTSVAVRQPDASALSATWGIARRTLGLGGDERAREESEMLRLAAAELPGEGWGGLREVTVSVALPRPGGMVAVGAPLPASGLFCIGLPTLLRTGTPFWVDGRFSGTISRTDIDIAHTPYNRLLYEEAVRLAQDLVEYLKRGDLEARRAVTQAMHLEKGPLATTFSAEGGLAKGAIVLAADGESFVTPDGLALPRPEETLQFWSIASAVDPFRYGFVLAERALMENGRSLLDALAPKSYGGRYDTRFVERPDGLPSMVEAAAAAHRRDGPEFWEPFLNWLVDRFPLDVLDDQAVLTVGTEDLAASNQRVFLRPAGAVDEESEEVMTTETIASLLRFIDERAVPMRRPGERRLTDIGRALTRDAGGGLVRLPRRDDLLNDALAPRLAELVEQGDLRGALALLRQAVVWLNDMSEEALGRVRLDHLRVPVAGEEGKWEWAVPTRVYFGAGWVPEREELLARAFGDLPRGRLVPWPELDRELGANEAFEAWREGMRRMGVRASPHLIAEKNPFPPLRAWSYEQLTFEGTRCPLPQEIEEAWRGFMHYAARRPARTRSGQPYDVRELMWLDGLERPEARAAAFELALRDANYYASRLSTEVARHGGYGDAVTIDSLWVHAVRTQAWWLIPTSKGLVASENAWYLEPAQLRQAVQERYSYSQLAYVLPEFSGAKAILTAVGVATLDDATATRLIRALQDCAAQLADQPEERLRGAQSLAADLYRRLAERCRADPALDLSSLLSAPVPLLDGRRLVAVNLASVDRVLIDDDPQRTALLERISEQPLLFVPLRRRDPHSSLIDALQRLLGEKRVACTSELSIETGFSRLPGAAPQPLGEYIARLFPGTPVVVDLVCLYAFGRDRERPPEDEEFRETWRRFGAVRVVVGHFPRGYEERSFFDAAGSEGPLLMLGDSLEPWERVAATWPVFGPEVEDTWNVYAQTLWQGGSRQFLARRQIGHAERERVEAVIGRPEADRIFELRDVLYAVWRARHPERTVAEFENEWLQHASVAEEVLRWLDLSDVGALRGEASYEERALATLASADVSVSTWQRARRELGLAPHRFERAATAYDEAARWLVAGLMSVAARHSVDLNEARAALEILRGAPPPAEVVEAPPHPARAVTSALERARQEILRRSGLEIFVRRIEDLAASRPTRLEDLVPSDAPAREVDVYRFDPEAVRSAHATETAEMLARVASALAEHLGESLRADELLSSPRVAALAKGWWANKFALLVVLHDAIRERAPKTAQELSNRRAFRGTALWQELWHEFPELGPVPQPTPKEPVRRLVELLGVRLDEDEIERDLARGSVGELGSRLTSAVSPTLDLRRLSAAHRSPAVLPERGSPGERGHHAARTTDVRAERELNGRLGEAFVFEQFRKLLPAFDETCWVSSNRVAYGLGEVAADDDLGYDFLYRDVAGALIDKADAPTCHIEVKATGGDDPRAPFPMTTAEWKDAYECHRGGSAAYVIVRVGNVRTTPEIFDVLIDPVALWHEGKLRYRAQDLQVYAGARADD